MSQAVRQLNHPTRMNFLSTTAIEAASRTPLLAQNLLARNHIDVDENTWQKRIH
jgi:hypothetical protein